jgi:hypothetical protein
MDPDSELELTNSLVPAFVLTGGASLPSESELSRDSLVAVTPKGLEARIILPEAALIRDLLSSGRHLPVYEVAARIQVPLGVGRALLTQMCDEELIVARPPIPKATQADRALLARIRAGLQEQLGA